MAYKVSPHFNMNRTSAPTNTYKTTQPTPNKTTPTAVQKPTSPTAPTQKLYGSAGLTRDQEIQRTFDVINDRMKQGLDNSSQLSHYKNMTGREYTHLDTGGGMDMDKFGSMFGDFSSGIGNQISGMTGAFTDQMKQMQGMYDGRMSALEKLITGLGNQNKYNASAQQQSMDSSQGVYDGQHQFTASGNGTPVGFTQNNNAVNDTLYKYLNNMWNGGF